MSLMNLSAVLILPFAALLVGSASTAQMFPHPSAQGEALIVPADSPVQFRGFDKSSGYARFEGRFVLTGKFTYGCGSNCADYEGPVEDSTFKSVSCPTQAWQHDCPTGKSEAMTC